MALHVVQRRLAKLTSQEKMEEVRGEGSGRSGQRKKREREKEGGYF